MWLRSLLTIGNTNLEERRFKYAGTGLGKCWKFAEVCTGVRAGTAKVILHNKDDQVTGIVIAAIGENAALIAALIEAAEEQWEKDSEEEAVG